MVEFIADLIARNGLVDTIAWLISSAILLFIFAMTFIGIPISFLLSLILMGLKGNPINPPDHDDPVDWN